MDNKLTKKITDKLVSYIFLRDSAEDELRLDTLTRLVERSRGRSPLESPLAPVGGSTEGSSGRSESLNRPRGTGIAELVPFVESPTQESHAR